MSARQLLDVERLLGDEDRARARRRCPSRSRSIRRGGPSPRTTITRSCDSAVVCSRSIASVAICTAVSKPNVTSVADRSLSIVFGTPTTGDALRRRACWRRPRVSSPPIAMSASMPFRLERLPAPGSTPPSTLYGFVRDVPRMVPPRGRMPRMKCDVERASCGPRSTPRQPSMEADELVAVDRLALAHDGSDHRVEPRAVAATGQQSDSHRVHVTRSTRSPVPCRADGRVVGRDRRRHDRRPRLRGRRRRSAARLVVPGVHAALPRSRGGSSTTPSEIWKVTQETLAELGVADLDEPIAAIGITEPARDRRRVGSRAPGEPLHRAIVWQDRRTAGRCDELREAGHLDLVRDSHRPRARPVLLGHEARVDPALGRDRCRPPTSAFGTVDSWLLWNLTGGAVHATDASNASRTMLYDIAGARLVRRAAATCSRVPRVDAARGAAVERSRSARPSRHDGVPRRHPDHRHRRRPAGGALRPGLLRAGDDEEHLRHRLVRADERRRRRARSGRGSAHHGRLDARRRRRRAVRRSRARSSSPAPRSSGCATASASSSRRRRSARSPRRAPTPRACTSCPAFTGLGSPYWDPYARGTIVGLTRGTGRAHLARAVVEAMTYQTRDVVEAMEPASGRERVALRADGGASVMDLLLQLQADQLQVPGRAADDRRRRPRSVPPTSPAWPRACGARSTRSRRTGSSTVSSHPCATAAGADQRYAGWKRAVAKAGSLSHRGIERVCQQKSGEGSAQREPAVVGDAGERRELLALPTHGADAPCARARARAQPARAPPTRRRRGRRARQPPRRRSCCPR